LLREKYYENTESDDAESDDAEITQPLAEMHPGKATKLILNWMTLNAKNGYEIELRLMVPDE